MNSEQWKVVFELGGSEKSIVFTDVDTVWPEKAARDLAEALSPLCETHISHRRVTVNDWEAARA
jgi:hypothetical protein